MDRLERLKVLARKRPEDPFPHYGLALEYKNRGEHEAAISTFQTLLENHPDYVPAYYHFGMSLQAAGQRERAAEVFGQGIERASRKGDAHARDELQAALQQLGE